MDLILFFGLVACTRCAESFCLGGGKSHVHTISGEIKRPGRFFQFPRGRKRRKKPSTLSTGDQKRNRDRWLPGESSEQTAMANVASNKINVRTLIAQKKPYGRLAVSVTTAILVQNLDTEGDRKIMKSKKAIGETSTFFLR